METEKVERLEMISWEQLLAKTHSNKSVFKKKKWSEHITSQFISHTFKSLRPSFAWY